MSMEQEPFYEKFDHLGTLLESMTVDQVKQKIGYRDGQRITLDQFIQAMSEDDSKDERNEDED